MVCPVFLLLQHPRSCADKRSLEVQSLVNILGFLCALPIHIQTYMLTMNLAQKVAYPRAMLRIQAGLLLLLHHNGALHPS
jgi:hypothetical protein